MSVSGCRAHTQADAADPHSQALLGVILYPPSQSHQSMEVQTVCWWIKQRWEKKAQALEEKNLGQPAAGSSREWEGQ